MKFTDSNLSRQGAVDLRDVITGLISTAVGIALLLWAIPYHLDEDPDLRLPVSMLPQIIGWAFVSFGAGLAFMGLRKRSVSEEGYFKLARENAQPLRTITVFLALIISTALLNWLPYLAVMPPLVFILSLVYGVRSRKVLILTTLTTPLLIWAGIVIGLDRPLP